MSEFVKKTAYKVRIGDLIKGKFIKREGWDPSYIVGKDGLEISRVNLVGLAVGREHNGPSSLLLDDGSGKIEVRAFGEETRFSDIDIGQLIQVVGRPREYNGEIFVSPEIIKPLSDLRWAEVRRKELEGASLVLDKGEMKEEKAPLPTMEEALAEEEIGESIEEDTSPPQVVYRLIKELDQGEGADVEEIIKKAGFANTEKIITSLLMEGDIFEVRNGRLKILE